jgi:hypothetical protein
MYRNWWIDNSGKITLKGEPQYIHDDGTHLRNEIDANNYINVYGGEVQEWTDGDGNPPDVKNQMVLDDYFILDNIRTSTKARDDFYIAYKYLNDKEKYRIDTLMQRSPYYTKMEKTENEKSEALMKKLNSPIRTCGRFGGSGY